MESKERELLKARIIYIVGDDSLNLEEVAEKIVVILEERE